MTEVPTVPALKDPSGIKSLEEMRAWAGDVYLQLQSLDPNATLPTVPGGGPGGPGAHTHDASAIVSGILDAARFNDTTHGARSGGALHALVVAAGNAGFLSGADKTILDLLNLYLEGWNGTIDPAADVIVTSDGATWTLKLEAQGGGDLTCLFAGVPLPLDCTPACEINLTTGTDATPVENFVFLTESGGVVSLVVNTTGFPDGTPHCDVATVLCQSAASGQTDGAMKVHVWTDHIMRDAGGHIVGISERMRYNGAKYFDGLALNTMVVSSPDAYLSVAAGNVYQLHKHDSPARDMQTGDKFYLINDPSRDIASGITTLDDITQDALGNSINNKYISLVIHAVVSEDAADCKTLISLPTGSYSTGQKALDDLSRLAVYDHPRTFVGAIVLVARIVVLAKDSGAWAQFAIEDLRFRDPSTSPGGGATLVSHIDLGDLTTGDAGHTQLLPRADADYQTLIDGSNADALHVHAGGGATTLIEAQSPSAVASVDFTTGIGSTYKHYKLTFKLVPASDDVEFWLRFQIGGSFKTDAGYRYSGPETSEGGITFSGSAGNTKLLMSAGAGGFDVGSAAGEHIHGKITFSMPDDTGLFPSVLFEIGYIASNGQNMSMGTSGHYDTVGAFTGVQLLFESGNIESGEASLIGWN